jgi:signal transduction histidine kinase
LAAYKSETNSIQTRLRSVVRQVRTEVKLTSEPIRFDQVHWGDTAISVAVYRGAALESAIGGIRPPRALGFRHIEDERGDFYTYGEPEGEQTIVASVDWVPIEGDLQRLGLILAGLWLPLVGLVGVLAAWAARATFAPLRDLTRQATQLGRRNIDRRLEVHDDAEFQEFTAALNGFLDRLEHSVRREERFAVDLAHELRTPLTVLRGRVETVLLQDRPRDEYVSVVRGLQRDIERLIALSEALLLSTESPAAHGESELASALDQAESRWLDRYVTAGVSLEVHSVTASVAIDDRQIAILLDNLLGNALRVSPRGGKVQLVGSPTGFFVADEGPGIPVGTERQIFDRFFRTTPTPGEGFGIGLSICHRLVRQAQGTIWAENLPERGLRVTVHLPTGPDPA